MRINKEFMYMYWTPVPMMKFDYAMTKARFLKLYVSFQMSEWIFYETTCTNMNFGRGLVTGRMWNEDGELLATIVQESLFRVKL